MPTAIYYFSPKTCRVRMFEIVFENVYGHSIRFFSRPFEPHPLSPATSSKLVQALERSSKITQNVALHSPDPSGRSLRSFYKGCGYSLNYCVINFIGGLIRVRVVRYGCRKTVSCLNADVFLGKRKRVVKVLINSFFFRNICRSLNVMLSDSCGREELN